MQGRDPSVEITQKVPLQLTYPRCTQVQGRDPSVEITQKVPLQLTYPRCTQVQGRDPSVEITQEVVEESEDERFDDMSDTVPSIELPAAEMARLEEISEVTADGRARGGGGYHLRRLFRSFSIYI